MSHENRARFGCQHRCRLQGCVSFPSSFKYSGGIFSEKINNFFAMAGSIICTLRKNGSVLFVSTRGMLPPPTMLAFDNKVAPSMDAIASVEISNIR